MIRFATRYAAPTFMRQNRPLTTDELMRVVPSAFSADKHESRSERYTYIPTITLIDRLRAEGFEPYYASQSRVRDSSRREFTKHLLRLRRGNNFSGTEVPEILLLNSHDGSSSYKMVPGMYRQVCSNGLVCWKSFGEIRIPHKGDIAGQVIEGAYEVLGIFDNITDNIEKMKSVQVNDAERQLLGRLSLEYKYDGKPASVTADRILAPRRFEDKTMDLWSTFNVIQENLIKGGLSGRTAQGRNVRTRPVTGIDGDIKLNQALWKMAEEFANLKAGS